MFAFVILIRVLRCVVFLPVLCRVLQINSDIVSTPCFLFYFLSTYPLTVLFVFFSFLYSFAFRGVLFSINCAAVAFVFIRRVLRFIGSLGAVCPVLHRGPQIVPAHCSEFSLPFVFLRCVAAFCVSCVAEIITPPIYSHTLAVFFVILFF